MTLKHNYHSNPCKKFLFVMLILGITCFVSGELKGEENIAVSEKPADSHTFGPVIERMVCDESAGKDMFIDFDTGRVTSQPDVPPEPGETFESWLKKIGADAMGSVGGRGNIEGLACWEMVVIPVDNASWDNIDKASYFLQFFEISSPGSPVFMTGKSELPVTYMFKTREGGIGILQIIGISDNPKGVKIQYKLLQSSKAEDSSQTAGRLGEINMQERLTSMQHLSKLGTALTLYAGDHKGKYPDKLEEFDSYRGIDLDWILMNVCYIGSNLTEKSPTDKPLAFDKVILAEGKGTVVLFNDGHVEFIKPAKLAELGIRPGECPTKKEQTTDDEKPEEKNRQIILKVVGPDEQPIAGAKVYQYYSIDDNNQRGKEYISNEDGSLNLTEETIFKYEWQKKGVLLYGVYENNLAGFSEVSYDDLGKEFEMKLTPACRVHGKIKSTDLDNLGLDVNWTNVYVWLDNERPMSYANRKGMFEFLLPAGQYKLNAYGERLYGKTEDIEITDGQKELDINFDLPADRLAHLIGKEAPEFQKIKGWLNSKPLKLKNLRGKIVLLDFWGTWCGPCIAAIPELTELHEKYSDKGLVIIGIHDDSMDSVKDLEKELEKLTVEHWKGKKILFVLALDGGGNCPIEGTQQATRGATTAAYGINSFPTMVLIDKQGKVVEQYYPSRNIETLEKMLAAK
jgi:thiol-disulfide isomerase/thioredoxin